MFIFFIHLLLTIVFALLLPVRFTSTFSGLAELGLYVSFMLVLWLTSILYRPKYFRQFWNGMLLFFFFGKELFVSNLKIIYYIITPGLKFRPAILELPLDVKSDVGIVLLANLITLTPGTLTLEISDDKKYLYYHAVNVPDDDLEKARRQVKNGFEKRVMAVTR